MLTILVIIALLLQSALSALPVRNCSKSLNLCTRKSEIDSAPIDCVNVSEGHCRGFSHYLPSDYIQAQVDDCLQVNMYPGVYSFAQDEFVYNSSLVLSAPQGGVIVTCDAACNGTSFLWLLLFQRSDSFLKEEASYFFVQLGGIHFESCQQSLQFDAMDFVGIYNCSFSSFTASAVDIFNCQTVQVEFSHFHNCSSGEKEGQYRVNSGGLSISYHINNISNAIYSNSSMAPMVYVTNCVFTENSASLGGNDIQQQINEAINRLIYIGRGGAMGVSVESNDSVDITVTIEHCIFENNLADFSGGAVYLIVNGINSQHSFSLRNCNFTGNVAGVSGSNESGKMDEEGGNAYGGGIVVGFQNRNAQSQPTSIYVIQCRFKQNTANFGGGLSVVQIYSQGAGNRVVLSDSYFEENFSDDVGGAVMFASLLYVQNRKDSYHYLVKNNTFFKNTSPGGIFGASFIHQDFSGSNSFLNNTGPGLRIVGSQVNVKDKLLFIGNNALEGGALYISAFGQIVLYRGAELFFTENVGRIGAAIVVAVQPTPQSFSLIFNNNQCFLTYEDHDIPPNQWDNVTIHASGNRAHIAPVVYISHLQLCSYVDNKKLSGINNYEPIFNISDFPQWPVFNISSDNTAQLQNPPNSMNYYIQTDPENLYSPTISQDPVPAYPGQNLQFTLKALDAFDHPTSTITRISDAIAGVKSAAFSEATDKDIEQNIRNAYAVRFNPALIPIQPQTKKFDLVYHVPTSANTYFKQGTTIRAVVDTPYTVRQPGNFTFQLSYTFCPPGYELKEDEYQSCECVNSFNILDCYSSSGAVVLRDGLWASSSGDSKLEVYTCPSHYCKCFLFITCDNVYFHNGPDDQKQCHPHRSGTLCGQCVNGTAVGVLRSKCRDCISDKYWALGFLVIGDILVCVVILVVSIKLRFVFPHSMKGFLFYIQTVYYATAYFPNSFWDARKYMLYLSSALSLYFPWDFCLYKDMSSLASFALRFIPPLIAVAVTIATVLILYRTKRYLKNMWHGIWTFALLLYTPLIYNCIMLLHCPQLPPDRGGSSAPHWFLDGEVICFGDAGHIFLGLIAAFVVAPLSFALPALFLLTCISHSNVVQSHRLVEKIYEAISAGYHDQAQWWGVWDLSRRLLLVIILVALPGRTVAALYIVIFALALHLFVLPYLKWWENLLEALILSNYIILLLLRSTQTILNNLALYSGTAVREVRGLELEEPTDKLTALFSFWYYLPILMLIVTASLWGLRAIALKLQEWRQQLSITEEIDIDSYREYTINPAVTVTSTNIDTSDMSQM